MRLVDIAPMLEKLDLEHYDKDYYVSQFSADWIYSWLDSQPTIEAEPVKHGRWVRYYDGKYIMCSSCEESFWSEYGGVTTYCPNCGAKMGE